MGADPFSPPPPAAPLHRAPAADASDIPLLRPIKSASALDLVNLSMPSPPPGHGADGGSALRKASSRNTAAGKTSRSASGRARLKIAAVIAFYIVTSISMVVVNKAVLNAVPLPLTLLWLQLAIAAFLLRLAAAIGLVRLPPLSYAACREAVPLVLINVLGLALNAYCLEVVDASYFQVARSMVLPFTVVLSRLALRERPSSATLASCLIVSTGFLLGTLLDVPTHRASSLSPRGAVLGVASSLTSAIHAIVIKRTLLPKSFTGSVASAAQAARAPVLPITNDSSPQQRQRDSATDTISLAYLNNLLSAVLLAPALLLSSEPAVLRTRFAGYDPTDGLRPAGR
ncbi:hypothetical protein HK405_014623, partial [Cladochytrium tenue]